jgi:hypothetical protein
MGVKVLDPTKLTLNILGCTVEGFSKGSFVTIEKEAPTFTVTSSVKGSKMASRHRHQTYRLTFRIDSTAGANTWLHAIYKLQELYGVVFPVPVMYRDFNGETSFFCITGILEEPRVDSGDAVSPTDWVITCPTAMATIGGSGDQALVAKLLQSISGALQLADFAGFDLSEIQGMASNLMNKATSTVRGFF